MVKTFGCFLKCSLEELNFSEERDFHFLCVLLCDIGLCNDLYMENCPAQYTYSLKGITSEIHV